MIFPVEKQKRRLSNQAQVDRKKITEYLLCMTHQDGSDKAFFFT